MEFMTVRSERRRYVCAYWVRRHQIVVAHGSHQLEISRRGARSDGPHESRQSRSCGGFATRVSP